MRKAAFLMISFIAFTAYTYAKNISTHKNPALGHACKGIIESGFVYEHIHKGSSTLERRFYIYLPESYYRSSEQYPVVYLLHGANGNESSWMKNGRALEIIDSLIHAGSVRECIYVFPNTNQYYNERDYETSRVKTSIEAYLGINGTVESSFVKDVVDFVDGSYRTIKHKDFRAICGLSLGGLQTLYITANNPDTFGHIGLFSPIIYPPLMLSRHSDFYQDLERKLSIMFEYYPPKNYMVSVGAEDPYLKSVMEYSEYLSGQGHPHELNISYGGHTWTNWSRYIVDFLEAASAQMIQNGQQRTPYGNAQNLPHSTTAESNPKLSRPTNGAHIRSTENVLEKAGSKDRCTWNSGK